MNVNELADKLASIDLIIGLTIVLSLALIVSLVVRIPYILHKKIEQTKKFD